MNWISFCMETLTTIIESLVILLSVSRMAGQELKGKKPILFIFLGTGLLSIFVIIMNRWSVFSFLTPLISMLFVIIYIKLFSHKTVLLLAASTVITYLVMNAIDYVIFFLFGIVSESPVTDARTFYLLMSPGAIRYCFLVTNKGIEILFLLCLYRFLPRIQRLKNRYLALLLCVSGAAYCVMSYLVSMILTDSILVMQTGILLSWIFMALCVVLLLAALLIAGKYQAERESNELLSMSNSLMETNYENLHKSQQDFAKLNHDFIHHVRVIQTYAEQENLKGIQEYSSELLNEISHSAAACKSGNDAVDAVVNFKLSEAKSIPLTFSYQINFAVPLRIDSVDICAILANQLDNAFDACMLISSEKERQVTLHIWQPSDGTILFQVSNTCLGNPLAKDVDLHTTKTDRSRKHGLGIRSIRESVSKYDGTLENVYKDGRFISIASLNLPEYNLKAKHKE